MATKSIIKNVSIKNRALAKGFASALENAQNKGSKQVTYSRPVEILRKDKIKDFFDAK